MTSNSPDGLHNVPSDDLSSLSSSSDRLKTPPAKSLVEQELESLREKAVARNLRDKYAGSGSFMSPEEAMAYISKQRKKTSNPSAPPSNLTSSAEISNWYMVQRQRELEERKKREEAEAYLRAYRGSAALFIESPQPPQSPSVVNANTPVASKDRKSSSTPSTPPTTNVTSPKAGPVPTVSPPAQSTKDPSASSPVSKSVDTSLPTQNSITQLDAYLRSVRGAAALQSKAASTKISAPSNSPVKTPDKPATLSKTTATVPETKTPVDTPKPTHTTGINDKADSSLRLKTEPTTIMKDSTDKPKQTIESKNSSPRNDNPSDEDKRVVHTKPVSVEKKTVEHRETQVDQTLIHRGGDSALLRSLDSVLQTPKQPRVENTKPMHNNIDNVVLDRAASLATLPSQTSLTTSSLSGDSYTPILEKKHPSLTLKVDTQWDEPTFSHDSEDPYIHLLEASVKKYMQDSVRNYQDLATSLVTPHVAKDHSPSPIHTNTFPIPSKTSSTTTNKGQLISDSQDSRLNPSMALYSPTISIDGPISFPPKNTRLSEGMLASENALQYPLQLLGGTSFQDDPLDLRGQEDEDEEDRFGSFESDAHMLGRNIWTVAADDLDGNASVITSNSNSSKSISQNTEYRTSSSAFQKLVQQQKEKYERRLKTRAEEHVEQIDEIIQQLNSIEVKYQSDIVNIKESLSIRDSNITSLHALISQARVKNSQLMDEAAQQQAKYSAQQVEYESVFKTQKDLEVALQGVQNEIKSTLAQREKSTADAIRKAQDEIRIEAERQFAQSNVAFIQLKKDLAAVEEEKKIWFKRAEEAASKLDGINSDANRRMEELNRLVIKAKEELEGSKMDLSRIKQQLVNERSAFTERVESMTRDVSKLSKECSEAHQLAKTIDGEKIQLKQEAAELKALSEELMSLVVS